MCINDSNMNVYNIDKYIAENYYKDGPWYRSWKRSFVITGKIVSEESSKNHWNRYYEDWDTYVALEKEQMDLIHSGYPCDEFGRLDKGAELRRRKRIEEIDEERRQIEKRLYRLEHHYRWYERTGIYLNNDDGRGDVEYGYFPITLRDKLIEYAKVVIAKENETDLRKKFGKIDENRWNITFWAKDFIEWLGLEWLGFKIERGVVQYPVTDVGWMFEKKVGILSKARLCDWVLLGAESIVGGMCTNFRGENICLPVYGNYEISEDAWKYLSLPGACGNALIGLSYNKNTYGFGYPYIEALDCFGDRIYLNKYAEKNDIPIEAVDYWQYFFHRFINKSDWYKDLEDYDRYCSKIYYDLHGWDDCPNDDDYYAKETALLDLDGDEDLLDCFYWGDPDGRVY